MTDVKNTGPWSPNALVLGENGRWPEEDEVLAAVKHILATT